MRHRPAASGSPYITGVRHIVEAIPQVLEPRPGGATINGGSSRRGEGRIVATLWGSLR